MANILSVENLTHNWGDIRLFNNLTFGLEEGDKAALIARNGTGKTTLLNILGEVFCRFGHRYLAERHNNQLSGSKSGI